MKEMQQKYAFVTQFVEKGAAKFFLDSICFNICF